MGAIHAYRRVFANPALTRLLLGEFVSSIGDWLYLVALLVVVFQRSESAALLGVVGAARVLPYIVLSVPAGIIVDRFDRRMVLIATDVARGLTMVALAALVTVEAPLLWIVLVTLLAASFSTFFGPALGAFLPTLVRDESELGPANSALASLDNLGFVVGPAIAGVLIAVGGLTAAFLINAVTFGIIAVILWRLPTSGGPIGEAEATTETQATPATAGFREAMHGRLRPMAGLLLVNSAGGFVLGGVSVLTVVIAVDILREGEAATGYLNAAIGVGGLVGAAGSAALVVRPRLLVPLVAGGLVLGAGLVGLGLSTALLVALVAMAVASAGSLIVDVVSTTLFQQTVPDAIRGRALGILSTVGIAAYAIGSLVIPIAAGIVGVLGVLVASGVVVAVGVGLGALLAVGREAAPALDPIRARLLDVPQFAGLPAARLAEAARRSDVREVVADELIVEQDAVADRFFVIASGEFAVTQRDDGGVATELRRLGPGDVFGEIGLLSGVPRTATVSARSVGTLLVLDAAAFAELVASGAGIGARLLRTYRSVPVAA